MRWFKVVDCLALGVAFGLLASLGAFGPDPSTGNATAPAAATASMGAAPDVEPGADRFAFAPSAPLEPPRPTDIASAATGQAGYVPTTWSAEEIAAGRARCEALLKTLSAVVISEPPFRHGACGAPAAVRLVSLGKSRQVALSPPALLTCDMVAALAKWLDRDLQPLARKHLGGDIVAIETMSDYSCRTAYNRPETRLSEHSQANALDIRGFRTSRGAMATVLANWGRTAREERALAAAGVGGGFVTTVERAAPSGGDPAGSKAAPAPTQAPSSVMTAGAWGDAFSPRPPDLGFTESAPAPSSGRASGGFGLSWLGGPATAAPRKPRRQAAVSPEGTVAPPGYAAFLRAAHRSACVVFGTVLGPEANAAHKNHLHVDMAKRKGGSFCQ